MKSRTELVRLLYLHQEGALANLDTGNDECRCGAQGEQDWRQHFADVLINDGWVVVQ